MPEMPAPMIRTSENSGSPLAMKNLLVPAAPIPIRELLGPAAYHHPRTSGVERVNDLRQRVDRDGSWLVHAYLVGHPGHAVPDVRGHLGGGTAGRDGVQNVVV